MLVSGRVYVLYCFIHSRIFRVRTPQSRDGADFQRFGRFFFARAQKASEGCVKKNANSRPPPHMTMEILSKFIYQMKS